MFRPSYVVAIRESPRALEELVAAAAGEEEGLADPLGRYGRSRWRSDGTFRRICVLIGCLGRLTFRVPLLSPLLHLVDLPLLGAHDVLGEFLDLWNLALLVGDLRHLYRGLVVRDHGVNERLVKGLAVGQLLRIHHHTHTPHLLRTHLHRHL